MKRQLFSLLILLSLAFSVSAQVAKTDASQANLRKHIEYLASDKLEGRRTGEAGATAAAGYIANAFAKLRLKPGVRAANGKLNYLQPFPYAKANQSAVTGYNVIAVLDGKDKSLKNEAIVIGAHYDHLGHGGEGSLAANSTEIHHGADDNASGTAAIIELARQFAKAKNNKRTIIFIAFSGEEEGLFGSKFYVNNPVFPIENTVAMFNLDMVGRLHDEKLTIGGIGTASEWKDWVNQNNKWTIYGSQPSKPVGNTMVQPPPLPVGSRDKFALQLNEDGFGPSDHSSFYTKKIPVLFFFTGTHLDYHKPSDTADKINYDGEERVIAYVASIVKAVDQNAIRPTYTVAKSSGTPGGRSGFSISLGTIPSYTDSTDGMVIDGVRDDSPASRAGLLANDKIVKLAGQEVKNVQDYTRVLGTMKADVEYEIVVVRGTETLTLKITPVKRP
ncbi:MAG: M20/M25/M40 family metallo-hydrolase [Pyrinomonadaceae bacterium]